MEGHGRSWKVIEGHGSSTKVNEGHGWSFPITVLTFQGRKVMCGWVACKIKVSAPVLWTLDLGFGTWTWDLDLGIGLGTWIWDWTWA